MVKKELLKISGHSGIAKTLKKLNVATRAKVFRKGLPSGARLVQGEASRNAPKRSEQLASDIQIQRKKSKILIGPSGKSFYGMFQEFGTKNHGRKPFLGPALKSQASGVIAEVQKVFKNEIQKA